ncbi:MAG: archease [Candidatus Omnitrophota bacterium]
MKNYEQIEHTADICIRVKAKDLKELFKNSATAMFEIMAEKKPDTRCQMPDTRNITVKQKADNLEELFINWLNELLSLSAAKELIFSDFKIEKLDKNNLQATAVGEDMNNYRVNTEIKAATYHQLQLRELKSGWQAEVIFDV